MICYLGRSFCTAGGKTCINTECGRYFTDEHKVNAVKWMGEDAPVAWGDFSEGCKEMIKGEK